MDLRSANMYLTHGRMIGGMTRTVSRFLWTPKKLRDGMKSNKLKTRWLEVAYIRQVWHKETGWRDANFC